MSKNKTRTKDKYRVVYNDTQRIELENEFRLNEYIAIPRKQEIAQKLQLSERQIKIWFQNRRAKKRKQLKRRVVGGVTSSTSSSSNNSSSNSNNTRSAPGANTAAILSNSAQSNSTSPVGIKCGEWPMQQISAADQHSLHLNHTINQDHASQAVIRQHQQAQVNAVVAGHTLRHSAAAQQHLSDSTSFHNHQHHHHHHQHHQQLETNRYLQNQSNELELHQTQQQQHALQTSALLQAQQPQSQQQSIISSNNHQVSLTTSSPPTTHLPLSHVQPSHSPYNAGASTQPGFLNDTDQQPIHIQTHQQQQHPHQQLQQHHHNLHHQQQHHYANTQQQQQHQQHHSQTHPQHMMYCNPQHHNQMLQVGLATHHAWRQFHATTPQQTSSVSSHQDIHVSPPMQNGTPSPQQIHQQQTRIQSPSFASQQQQQQAVAAAAQMQHQHYWYQHQHHHPSNYVPIGSSPMQEIVETL